MGPVAAIVGGALIGGVSSLIGSNKAASSADKAAKRSNAEQQREFDLVRGDTAPYRQVGASALDQLAKLYGLQSGQAQGPLSYEQWSQQNPQASQFSRPSLSGLPQGMLPGLQNGNRNAYNQYVQGYQPPAQAGPNMSGFFASPDYQFNLSQGQQSLDRSLLAQGRGLSGANLKAGERYASGLASQQYGDWYNRLAGLAGIGQTGVSQSAAAGANAANNISSAYQNLGQTQGSAYLAGAQGVNNSLQGGIGNALLYKYLGQ